MSNESVKIDRNDDSILNNLPVGLSLKLEIPGTNDCLEFTTNEAYHSLYDTITYWIHQDAPEDRASQLKYYQETAAAIYARSQEIGSDLILSEKEINQYKYAVQKGDDGLVLPYRTFVAMVLERIYMDKVQSLIELQKTVSQP